MKKSFSRWLEEQRAKRRDRATMRAIQNISDRRVRDEVLAQYND